MNRHSRWHSTGVVRVVPLSLPQMEIQSMLSGGRGPRNCQPTGRGGGGVEGRMGCEGCYSTHAAIKSSAMEGEENAGKNKGGNTQQPTFKSAPCSTLKKWDFTAAHRARQVDTE
jgi:hypothetical protein